MPMSSPGPTTSVSTPTYRVIAATIGSVAGGTTEASTARTITVEAGKTYYLECGVEMGLFAGRPAMKIVNEQEAKSVLPNLKYLTK